MAVSVVALRRRGVRVLLAAALAVAAAGAAAGSAFADWSESFAADWMRLSAERATFSQYFGGQEQAAFDSQLTPITPAGRDRRAALARAGLARLDAFEPALLTHDERVGAATLRWSLQRTLAGLPFDDHGFIFSQLGGPHLRYVNLLAEHQPLRKAADLAPFLSRLSQIDQRLDEAIARCREAVAQGLLPPRFILERARTQVQAFLAQGAAGNDIVKGLAQRSARIEGLLAAARQAAVGEATALLQDRVRPAYQRVLALLDELHPRTTADAGLWRLPRGDEAYAQALAEYTTTSMGAEQIHALGLCEVSRIEAQMDRVLQGLGRREGTVEQRMVALRAELQPPAEPDPRPAIIERYAAAVQDAQRRAQDLFNLQPRAPVEVRRVPALTERTASAHYTTPTPDGSRPGIFWAPLPGPHYDLLRIRSLAVHEAVPGHHFQLALQQEQADLPRWRQRRVFGGGSAHSEGWALYAERLALDHGWYDGDAHALLGGLDGQLFRARRLVVDTGLHAKRWTREQAIAYGLPAHEVERYVANPGQATAYMVGMLHILALRDEADLHSLMVWQRGALLLQHHRRSRDRPIGDWFSRDVEFGPDVLHDLRSISKSVVGLLVGQAVGRGEFTVDQPVLDFFPELSPLRDGARERITVAHLLNMASGLAWAEAVTTYGTAANDETALWSNPAPWRYILEREVPHAPGMVWNYNGGCTVLLAEIVQRRAGRPWLDLARDHLFDPLAITRWEWRSGAFGKPLPYAGLRLSAADLLKLGRVMLDGGRWQGRQLVSANWVQTSLTPQIAIAPGQGGYSQQWWNGSVQRDGQPLVTTVALGNGGQRLHLVPALDLAVVFTAGQYNSPTIGAAEGRLFRQIVATL